MTPVLTDAWLTCQLGKSCYKLAGSISESTLRSLPLEPCLVSAEVNTSDLESSMVLRSNGFYLVSEMVVFEVLAQSLSIIEPSSHVDITFATPGDAEMVKCLAERAFSADRFHIDPGIDNQLASKIKGEWAGNFFSGQRGQWMIVARLQDRVIGFIQVLMKANDFLVIDLIAVDNAFHGKGLAKAMICYMAHNCGSELSNINVGTQVCNVTACNLYRSLGFRLVSSYNVFHKHILG